MRAVQVTWWYFLVKFKNTKYALDTGFYREESEAVEREETVVVELDMKIEEIERGL